MSYQSGIHVIKQFVDTLSTRAGVYRMIDAHNQVLYVGKAKNLRNRVHQYTHADKQSLRIQRMIARTHHMEFVETESESHALLLEADLIKSLKPYYNILLRDDKSYPEIEISFENNMAKIQKHRGVHRKNCQYFGPFSNARAVNKTIDILRNVFYLAPLTDPNCAADEVRHRRRYHTIYKHQFMRSFVPDGSLNNDTDFIAYVDEVIQFLSGKNKDLLRRLQNRMQQASDNNDFEQALIYRDRLQALQDLHISQGCPMQGVGDCDVFAICRFGSDKTKAIVCVQILFYRHSATAGSAVFFPRVDVEQTDGHILSDFISQYYDSHTPPAGKIYVSAPVSHVYTQGFKQVYGSHIHHPQRGVYKTLIDIAKNNAQSAMDRHKSHISTHNTALDTLCDILNLDDIPQRIEVYDNSHHQGDSPVGAMIVVNSQGFDKKSYRSWTIKTPMQRRDNTGKAGDDYAMMYEVLTRRFARAIKEKLPDLVVVDGGRGQLSTAQKAMREIGVAHIPLVCVAKGKNRNDGTETFYTPAAKIPIAVGTDLHFFMQRIRDESHRFAIAIHRKKRRKKMLTSPLDAITGIGKIRRTKLLQYFGSSKGIKGAGITDLMQVDGINRDLAEKIYSHFHKS